MTYSQFKILWNEIPIDAFFRTQDIAFNLIRGCGLNPWKSSRKGKYWSITEAPYITISYILTKSETDTMTRWNVYKCIKRLYNF